MTTIPVPEGVSPVVVPDKVRIKIEENAKGEPSISVSVADDDPDWAIETATAIYESLKKRYPR